jgi:hypothetical protein
VSHSKTPAEMLLSSEAVNNEVALEAYSKSRIIPVAIKHCQKIDDKIALEISDLFSEYSKIRVDVIKYGNKIAACGLPGGLSATDISKLIDESVEKVEQHFRDPLKRNIKSCLGYKIMLEFDLMFVK